MTLEILCLELRVLLEAFVSTPFNRQDLLTPEARGEVCAGVNSTCFSGYWSLSMGAWGWRVCKNSQ